MQRRPRSLRPQMTHCCAREVALLAGSAGMAPLPMACHQDSALPSVRSHDVGAHHLAIRAVSRPPTGLAWMPSLFPGRWPPHPWLMPFPW